VIANGATFKRCYCKDPVTGREMGAACPKLDNRRHGTWCLKIRLETTTGTRQLKRSGFDREADASGALDIIRDLVKLAGDDERAEQKIGDLIFEKSARGGELPALEDVRRRLGLRAENLGASGTFAAAWGAYCQAKRKWRPTTRARNEEIGAHWLLPVLEDVQVDRITAEHCAHVFERLEMFNEEIERAREEKRTAELTGDVRPDVRKRVQVVGVSSEHRIYAVLRAFLNHQVRKLHAIPYNPIFAVELEPVDSGPVKVWTPEQAGRFLDVHQGDRLYWLWELALLRGLRRGELCGMADDAFDPKAAAITVNVALLVVNGRLVWGKPKSRAGERTVGLDADSVTAGKAHRKRRAAERLAAGEAWEDSGRMFTDAGGQPQRPDWVSRRFKALAAEAGLPVIKFHAARHTAATLALGGKVDVKIVAEQLGHSRTAVTQDMYQHVSVELQVGAAETVRALLPERARRKTG
jgi:integrase